MVDNTIVAISTPFGESGIGIIRMSGTGSLIIADKIFRRPDKKNISVLEDHSINYGWIIDPNSEEVVDEVLLSILKKPRTYTKEDMIEINCHGGWIALNRTIDLIINLGARIAFPGEFTKRAFINGRIDLTQAEAVLNIIRARTESELSFAVKGLRGSIKNNIKDIREKLFLLLSYNNARIEFDEQISIDKKNEKEILNELIKKIEDFLIQYERKKGITEGIRIVICGKTNVGKSSILNAIYGEERILTSNIAGTTRDSIQVEIYLEGMIYKIIDTAGITEGKTKIEKLSIINSEKEVKNSDCLIVVFDISKRLDKRDKKIIKWIKELKKDIIWVLNKKDLTSRIELDVLENLIESKEIVRVSAKNGSGIEKIIIELKKKKKKFSEEKLDGLLINKRHERHLSLAWDRLIRIRNMYQKDFGEEIIAEELKYSIKELDNIVGNGIENDEIKEIFNQFCIGK